MLKVVLLFLLSVSLAWSNDQAKSRRSSNTPAEKVNQKPYCPVGEDYFQRDLNALAYPNPMEKDPKARSNSLNAKILQVGTPADTLIARDCFELALNSVTAGAPKKSKEKFRANRFFRCNSDNVPIDHQDEPCASEEYKNLVHSSFELTTTCLKEFVSGSQDVKAQNAWVESYFKMLSTESGLHINVVSRLREDPGLAAVGITQLRPRFTMDFLNRTLPDLRKFLMQSKTSPACKALTENLLTAERVKKLYGMVEVIDSKTKSPLIDPKTKLPRKQLEMNVCSNIDINDGQPLLNLIIGFANLRLYRDNTFNEIMKNPTYSSAFKDLSEEEMLDMQIKITSWSYNLGSSAARERIQGILDHHYPNQTVPSVRHFFETVNKQVPGLPDRRNYIFALEDRYKLILKGRKSCRTDLQKP